MRKHVPITLTTTILIVLRAIIVTACTDTTVCNDYDTCSDTDALYRSGHLCRGFPWYTGGAPVLPASWSIATTDYNCTRASNNLPGRCEQWTQSRRDALEYNLKVHISWPGADIPVQVCRFRLPSPLRETMIARAGFSCARRLGTSDFVCHSVVIDVS